MTPIAPHGHGRRRWRFGAPVVALLTVGAVGSLGWGALGGGSRAPAEQPGRVLRVCADPDNLPFSTRSREGFENRIAELIARDLEATVAYTWQPQQRGFIRETLRAGRCDVVIGVPASYELVLPTRPYYRSTYAFVYRSDAGFEISSFDDPILRRLRIGVALAGDDYTNPPPAHALAQRGIIDNVSGVPLTDRSIAGGAGSQLISAVARGDLDVVVLWGPMAGFFAHRQPVKLTIVPVSPQIDLPFLPMVFDIAMGVAHGDSALKAELESIMDRRRAEIEAVLRQYHVPLLAGPVTTRPN